MENNSKQDDSFFSKIFGSFFSQSGESAVLKKQLKSVVKQLKRSHLNYYDTHYNELNVSLARFFYQCYRFVGPLQPVLERYVNSAAIKTFIIEKNFDGEMNILRSHFTEDYINDMSKNIPTKELLNNLKKEFAQFKKGMAKNSIQATNEQYSSFQFFLELVNFDFFYFLRQFDPKIPELDFIYNPSFVNISGIKHIEGLKDFASIVSSIDFDSDWGDLFAIVNELRGFELISNDSWKKLKKVLDEIKKTQVFDSIIAILDSNPAYSSTPIVFNGNIVFSYVEEVSKELQVYLKKIISDKKNKNVNEIVRFIFNRKPPSVKAVNYSEHLNAAVSASCSKCFLFVPPINFLKAFFVDYADGSLREIINHYVIVGKWVTQTSSQHMSDSLNYLLEVSVHLAEFDNSLGKSFKQGQLLRTYSREGGRRNPGVLDKVVDEINEDAMKMLINSAQYFVRLAKSLHGIIDDYNGKLVLLNWKELESFYKGELLEDSQIAYKKIYAMVQLLQLFLQK